MRWQRRGEAAESPNDHRKNICQPGLCVLNFMQDMDLLKLLTALLKEPAANCIKWNDTISRTDCCFQLCFLWHYTILLLATVRSFGFVLFFFFFFIFLSTSLNLHILGGSLINKIQLSFLKNLIWYLFLLIQFGRSVVSDSATPWTSTSGLPVHLQLPEFTQTHVHWVGDAIQPSHPLSSPSPLALNLSQHQGLFQWVSSSHQVAKVLEFQLQPFQWTPRTDLL